MKYSMPLDDEAISMFSPSHPDFRDGKEDNNIYIVSQLMNAGLLEEDGNMCINKEKPNIFYFATSELSQDAFLCWLLSWADEKYSSTNSALHEVAINFFKAILLKAEIQPPACFSDVRGEKQKKNIDILFSINNDTIVLIEDKIGTTEHSDQLPRYKRSVSENYKNHKIIPVYIQTGDQSDYSEVKNNGFKVFRRIDVLNILESTEGIAASKTSDIYADFCLYLRAIENKVQSYVSLSPAQWEPEQWKGFYTRLQEELGRGRWKDVSNPSNGFLGFDWGWQPQCKNNCELFLQLEESKFCFKIQVLGKSERAELRNFWHDRLIEESSKHNLKLKKPPRFGNGGCMTVAVLDQNYPCVNENGVIDISQTLDLMNKAEALLKACGHSV